MKNFTIVFIHGYTASHVADWYPNLSKELDRLKITYIIPDLPGGDYPHAQEWLEKLHSVIAKIETPIILFGHSLGSRTALLYLEKYQPKNIEKVFLLAAFANKKENALREEGKAYPDFFEHIINLEIIKPLVKKFIVIHAKDDSSIPFQQGQEIAADLYAEFISYSGRDHFSDPNDATYILKELRKELEF